MTQPATPAAPPPAMTIERLDPALDAIIPRDVKIEKLADGFKWTEGTIWSSKERCLYFSDVKQNTLYRWSAGRGIEVQLKNSGTTGVIDPKLELMGSNGLALDAQGRLLVCQHGNRRVVRLEPDGTQTVLADRLSGKRLNSPNDIAVHHSGDVYFTDPWYGLAGFDKSPDREIDKTGVYRIPAGGGGLQRVADELMPNGIVFAPDGVTVYVTNQRRIVVCERQKDGSFSARRTFFELPEKGEFDGLAVDPSGNLFACNWMGAIFVITPSGKNLGVIRPGECTANCEVTPDGEELFIAAGPALMRVHLAGQKGKGH